MIKSGKNYEDINNYRNSRYFAQTVRNIRKNSKNKDLVIFAGACQSYYEALIAEGANFASSPARILIDFIDPLVVAEKIATTDATKFLTIRDIEDDLRDGERGINRNWGKWKEKRTNNLKNMVENMCWNILLAVLTYMQTIIGDKTQWTQMKLKKQI